ncbi:PAS domain S-box protein [Myxococcota bacterium]|nr:PAS domain S-box protein [Myxococcota bacterium]
MKALLLDAGLRLLAVSPPPGDAEPAPSLESLLPEEALRRALRRVVLGADPTLSGWRTVLVERGFARRVRVDAVPAGSGLLLHVSEIDTAVSTQALSAPAEDSLPIVQASAPLVRFTRLHNPAMTLVRVSASCRELFGRAAAELLGEDGASLLSWVHPDDRARLLEREHLAYASGRPYRVTYRLQHPDGESRWVWEIGARDSEGHLSGFWIGVDGLVEAERDLVGNEQLFRDIAENIPELLWVSTPDGRRLQYVTPSHEAFYGVSLAEVYLHPRGWLARVHDEDRERVRDELRRALARGEELRSEYRVLSPSGEDRWMLARVYPVRDAAGRVRRTVGLSVDITERRRAEQAARDRETSYRALLENASDAILLYDKQGQVLVANNRACALTGYSEAELRTLRVSDLTAADDLITSPLTGGPRLIEHRLITKGGGELPVEISVSALEDGRVQAIVRDIRQRKEEERERQKIAGQLQQARTLESVGRLAGGIAHDFNNMLAVILNRAEMILQDLGPASSQSADMKEIWEAASRAAALTRQLLVFSRRDLPDAQPLDLNDVLKNLTGLLRRSVGEHIGLEILLTPGLPAVRIGLPQIENMVVNMAINARDAMPSGGTLTIQTSAARIDGRVARRANDLPEGEYVVLSVQDTGVGMSAEVAVHIFEPFFTTKPRDQGTGLGLATAYGTVKGAGGRIVVQSAPGRGARFDVWLPATPELPRAITEPSPAPSAAETTPSRPITVLLVEDEHSVRQVIAQMLARHGYTVIEAEAGDVALERVAERPEPIDVLVTDVIMPRMSGKELADALTAARPEVRVLFMSGYTDDLIARHGVLEPGIAFLQKPFRLVALVAALRRLLEEPPTR